jgi:hypothetical protein
LKQQRNLFKTWAELTDLILEIEKSSIKFKSNENFRAKYDFSLNFIDILDTLFDIYASSLGQGFACFWAWEK